MPSEAGKPVVNLSVIRGALSLACLTIGANIAFGNITSGMGAGELNVDHLTVYSGPGGRRELAVWRRPGGGHHLGHGRRVPHAVLSGVIMMAVMALILFFAGCCPKSENSCQPVLSRAFCSFWGRLLTILPGDGHAAAFGRGRCGRLPVIAAVTMFVTAVFRPVLSACCFPLC